MNWRSWFRILLISLFCPASVAAGAAHGGVFADAYGSAQGGANVAARSFLTLDFLADPVNQGESSVFLGGIIENHGQYDPRVRYVARCGAAVLYFTRDAIVMDFPAEQQCVWIWMDAIAPTLRLEPRRPRAAYINRFVGADPNSWVTDIPLYDELLYREISPGCDLCLIPRGDRLCCELRTRAAAVAKTPVSSQAERLPAAPAYTDDPSPIYFRFEGLEESPGIIARLDPDGQMHALRWRVSRTGSDGAGATLSGDREDVSTVDWSTMLGGGDQDYAHAISVDAEGNILVGGYTRSGNFPVSAGAYDSSHNGDYDGYIAKLTPDGSELLWATYLGGALEDRVFIIACDANEDLLVAGQTYSANFPTTEGAYDRTFGSPRDGYVAKLSGAGNVLQWSTYLGGTGKDRVWVLDVDASGRPVVVGETNSPNFPTTPGAYDQTYEGLSDGYITKLDALGQSIVWSTLLGGALEDKVMWMTLDESQCPVVCGSTTSSDFPVTPAAFDTTFGGIEDCFIARVDETGQSVLAATYLGGGLDDIGYAVALDSDDDVVVAGATLSSGFPVTEGAFDDRHNGDTDAFVTRLDPQLTSLIFSTFIGGEAIDEAFTLVIDHAGRALISGETASNAFPTTQNAYDETYNGGIDAFLTCLDRTGAELIWSSFFGGSDIDGGWELVLDAAGNPLLTGPSRSGNLPTTSGAYDETPNGGKDAFVARFILVDPADVNAPDLAGRGRSVLLAKPNPTSGIVTLQLYLDLPRPTAASLVVMDVNGRRIATVHHGEMSAGWHHFAWDGCNSSGYPAAAGVYWLCLAADEPTIKLSAEQRIVLIR